MPHKVIRLPNEPIVVVEMIHPVHPLNEPAQLAQAVADFKHEIGGRVCRILDFTNVQLDFGAMMQGMGTDIGKEGGATDPDVSTLFVSTQEIPQIGVEALQQQEQYGKNQNVLGLFKTRDEALAVARAEVAKWPKK